MSGGMYAINRKWFNRLGGYDIGMDMWGGENLEMSFRVWMCGGSLEVVPCSHVGHVFRKRSVYQLANDNTNPRKNFMRLAEVWMDNYKTHYYDKIGGRPSSDDVYGDVTERKELRTKLHCQSFQWYLKNIYPELFVPNDALAFGEIRSHVNVVIDKVSQPVCLDSIVGSSAFNLAVKIWPCHGQGGNQYWLLSSLGEIRRDDSCFDYAGKNVVIYPCHGQRGNQQWQYTPNGQIRHMGTKRCLELSVESNELLMSLCGKSDRQIWKWKRNKPSESMSDGVDSEVLEEQKEPIRLRPQYPFVNNQKPVTQEIAGDDY